MAGCAKLALFLEGRIGIFSGGNIVQRANKKLVPF